MGEKLDEIALQHQTDKASDVHDYCRTVYESLFEPLRTDPITLLELGVSEGSSIRTWRDYFPNATIIGVDNNLQVGLDKDLKHLDLNELNIFLYELDQADPQLPTVIAEHIPLDIVIDDCSHDNSMTAASFNLLWPCLKPGGLYIIEDLCSYEFLSELTRAQVQLAPSAIGQHIVVITKPI